MPSPNSRLRFRLLVAALSCAAIAGCSAAPSGATPPPGGPGATDATVPVVVPDGNKPSGAKVRVANLFNPITGDPGPIDVYADAWADSGSKPLISVPYGEVSPAFDPTVADDAGDMFLSFYQSGVTGNGNELISQTETLKGGEDIVFYLATGSLQDSGRYGGALGTAFAVSTVDFGGPTLAPGKALLTVSAVGLDKILKNPDALSWIASFGQGCAPGIDGDPNNIAIIDPGTTGAEYALDPGQATVSFHPYDTTSGNVPGCTNASDLNVPLQATAGAKLLLILYAPKDGELKALVISVTG
jgi:hypothetical protein